MTLDNRSRSPFASNVHFHTIVPCSAIVRWNIVRNTLTHTKKRNRSISLATQQVENKKKPLFFDWKRFVTVLHNSHGIGCVMNRYATTRRPTDKSSTCRFLLGSTQIEYILLSFFVFLFFARACMETMKKYTHKEMNKMNYGCHRLVRSVLVSRNGVCVCAASVHYTLCQYFI